MLYRTTQTKTFVWSRDPAVEPTWVPLPDSEIDIVPSVMIPIEEAKLVGDGKPIKFIIRALNSGEIFDFFRDNDLSNQRRIEVCAAGLVEIQTPVGTTVKGKDQIRECLDAEGDIGLIAALSNEIQTQSTRGAGIDPFRFRNVVSE